MKSDQLTKKVAKAVERTLELVQGGMNPTKALAKTANSLQLLPDYVKLAAAAYNKGVQHAQRENATTILDKLAEFPMADAEQAIELVWGPRGKEKVSSEYRLPPTWIDRRYTQETNSRLRGGIPKAAESLEGREALAAPTSAEPSWAMERAYNKSLAIKSAVEEARYQSGAARDSLLKAMGELGDYFKLASIDRVPLGSAEWHARLHFGSEVEPLFDFVRARNSFDYRGEVQKIASLEPLEVDPTQAPWSLIHNCIKAAEHVLQRLRDHQELTDEYETKSAELLAPYGGIPGRRQEKAAKGLLMGGLLGSTLSGFRNLGAEEKAKTDKAVMQGLMDLEDPEHQSRLRGIQAEAMLQDFMANDDVIAGYDPEDVLQVYNEISGIMPQASTQPAVMRSALRERLTSQPATFDAAQLADIEAKVRRQSATPPSPAPPLPYTETNQSLLPA